jgi:hypothetical protein
LAGFAPVTLVFNRARDIVGQIGPAFGILGISDLHELPSPDQHADPQWHIEGHEFDLRRAHPDKHNTSGRCRSTCIDRR